MNMRSLTKDRALRGGVVGFGKMGLLHGAIVNALEDSSLCAVCEANDAIRKDSGLFLPHVNFYKDYSDMLGREKLDFVFIITPPASHIQIASECVRHGCHFFIEKPLCVNASSAEPLLGALEKKHLVTMVGFMMRYVSTFCRAREIIASGLMGRIFTVNATTYVSQLFRPGKGWRYSPEESGGGVLIMQGIHTIDLLCWFFGVPRAVNARIRFAYSKEVEDFCHATFSWENGTIGFLDSSWSVDNHRLLSTTLCVNSENGTLVVDDDMLKLYLRKDGNGFAKGWSIQTRPELEKGVMVDIGGPHYTRQDSAFIEAIVSGGMVESNVKNAYMVQKVIDCIYESARSDGNTVCLS